MEDKKMSAENKEKVRMKVEEALTSENCLIFVITKNKVSCEFIHGFTGSEIVGILEFLKFKQLQSVQPDTIASKFLEKMLK